ncbi:tRNA(adenine(34)) deaminase, chloroplastic-like [Aristolochia californica]|uniref:tRNA(adenine(34)) deaminase, chloroplastic-like n=1 Tax=Aristolochia californica TaxID=171875 RepID=UPI0035E15EC5
MDSCICSGMSFKNKGDFFSTGYYASSERLESYYSYLGAFPVYGTTVNPRVLYGLRQSTLMHWSVSRRLSLAVPGYCRLAAPCDCHCVCERMYRSRCPPRERWGERRLSYMLREKDEFDSSNYDSFNEILSLLTDAREKSYVEKKNKISTHKRDTCEKEIARKVDDKHLSVQRNRKHLKKEEKFVGKGSSRRLESERMVNSIDKYRQAGKGSSLKGDTSEGRKDGSSSSYYSALSEGETEGSLDLISTAEQRIYGHNIAEDTKLKRGAKFKKENIIGESSKVREHNSQTERFINSQAYEEDVMELSQKEDLRKPDIMKSDFEWDSAKNLQRVTEVSGSRVSGTQKASTSGKLSKMRVVDVEETSTSYTNLAQKQKELFFQNEQKVDGQKESRRESKIFNEAPRSHEDDVRESRAAVDLVEEVWKQHIQTDDQFDSRIQLKEKTQMLQKTSEIQSSDIDRRSSFKKPYQSRVVESRLLEDAREHPADKKLQVGEITESSEESHRLENASETHAKCTERTNDSRWMYRTSHREENLASSASMVHEGRDKHDKTDEQATIRIGSRKEPRIYDRDLERASNSQKIAEISTKNQEGISSSELYCTKETEKQEIGAQNEFERKSQRQLILRGSISREESNSYNTQEAFYETLDDKNDRIGTEEVSGTPAELVIKDNTIDSADRLDKSSKQIIGEFFDKVQEEMSTSKTASMLSKEEKYILKDQNMSVDMHISFDDTRRSSSGGPGPKGPSDEMWAETGLSSQEPSVTAPDDTSLAPVVESADPSNAENAVVRKSGRSLWGYIGNIVRTGWSSRAESHTSSIKQSAKSSSNESVSSESWFSGNEVDLNDVRKERRATPKEPIVKLQDQPQPTNASIPDKEKSTTVFLQDKKTDIKADAAILVSSTELQGHSSVIRGEPIGKVEDLVRNTGAPSGVVTSDSSLPSFPLHSVSPFSSLPLAGNSSSQSINIGEKNLGISEGAKVGGGVPSHVRTVDLSRPPNVTSLPTSSTTAINLSSPPMGGSSRPPGSLATSSGKEKISEVGEIEARFESGKQKQAGPSGTEGNDSELKQRKLQRNKQVPRDRFDEWEEAFKLEQEQTRVDEMFMREALIEAKKAADIWEVPVGAVLVQHGKIIARGCNLVEELRDSTAHAEMICIREASNLLRTWRLSETTLYVTLEPCAMCAGAILQARIDTVVWGAPNKLLGADGTWISLFPSETDPAAPVHPFHPKMTIRRGILATECADVMQQFFRLRRKKIKKEDPPSSRLPLASPTKFLSKIHDIFSMMFCL